MNSADQMATLPCGFVPVSVTQPIPVERRSEGRVVTVYRVALASAGSDAGLCRVHNFSDSGMMLVTSLIVEEGQCIAVSFTDALTIPGTIIWIEGSKVGVRFAVPIDSAAILQMLAGKRGDGALRAPRLETDTIAVASSELGTEVVRVLNISQHGLKVAHVGHFRAGMPLNIVFESGIEGRAVVRWSQGSRAGLMLLDAIPYQLLGSASAL